MWARGAGSGPYPAEVGLEGLPDLLPLGVAAVCDDVDDGALVGSKSLHGFPQRFGVCIRVEVIGWTHSSLQLQEAERD